MEMRPIRKSAIKIFITSILSLNRNSEYRFHYSLGSDLLSQSYFGFIGELRPMMLPSRIDAAELAVGTGSQISIQSMLNGFLRSLKRK